jgi:hypothetical protein
VYRPGLPPAQPKLAGRVVPAHTRAAPPTLAPVRPGIVQRSKRELRGSTTDDTVRSKTAALSGPDPSNRQRRSSASYSNVDLHALLGSTPHQEIRDAEENKKIFSGYREDVSWSTGFASGFWDDFKKTQGWRCAIRGPNCTHNAYSDDHDDLEIGHKHGFYTIIAESVDPKTVCDDTDHWEVYLYADVERVNENYDNLEPQCKKCNRDARQQRHDDRGGGKYQPEKKGSCPGTTCTARKVSNL